jgi:hypothetical protein
MCSPSVPAAPAPAPAAPAASTGADATTLAQQERLKRVQASGLDATIVAGDTLGGGGTEAKKTGATVLGGTA